LDKSGVGSSFTPNTSYACTESFGQAYNRKKFNRKKDGIIVVNIKIQWTKYKIKLGGPVKNK
jgi:hypothetical protein